MSIADNSGSHIAPQLSHGTKKAFKIANNKMCNCVQAKKEEVLTNQDTASKKKEKLSKECHKDLD